MKKEQTWKIDGAITIAFDQQKIYMCRHYEEHHFTPTRYLAARCDVCLQTIRKYLHSHHERKHDLTDAPFTGLNFEHE